MIKNKEEIVIIMNDFIKSSKIPYKYFKSYTRRERKRKIKNLFKLE